MIPFSSFTGPVLESGGKLFLQLPLASVGSDFPDCVRGISEIRGDALIIELDGWLAQQLSLEKGSLVVVDNRDSRFNIRLREAE